MRDARHTTGYMSVGLGGKTGLFTSCDIAEELFSMIEYVSEIESVGIGHIKKILGNQSNKKINYKEVFKQFQSFVRQARVYYDSAEKLHYRASPLNYYYSFMNLAKALLVLHEPSYFQKTAKSKSGKNRPVKHTHGLKLRKNNVSLKNQTLLVDDYNDISRPIFRKLYELLIGYALPPRFNLNVINSFGYCTDIAYEYEFITKLGAVKTMPAMARVNANDPRKVAWAMIAINQFSRFSKFKKYLEPFDSYFEEVEVAPNSAIVRQNFQLDAPERKFYNFFESKKEYNYPSDDAIPLWEILADCKKVLKPYYSFNVFEDKFNFYFNAPLRNNLQLPFNEILSIYSIMFFLSSLVRYNPKYLEDLFLSSEMWLIKKFIQSTPLTFLRHIANLILDKEFTVSSR